MAWVGMVDGRILLVVWFEGSVNSEAYLEQVLKKPFGLLLKGGNTTQVLVSAGRRNLPLGRAMSEFPIVKI